MTYNCYNHNIPVISKIVWFSAPDKPWIHVKYVYIFADTDLYQIRRLSAIALKAEINDIFVLSK